MKDGEIKTSSRGGQDYDIATTYIKGYSEGRLEERAVAYYERY